MNIRFVHRFLVMLCLLLPGFATSAFGQLQSSAVSASGEDRFKSFWDGATLYQNEAAAVQSLSLVGRYHGQYWNVDNNQGGADGWDNRRMIFGVQSHLYDQYLLDVQMHLNDSFSPVYDGLYTASLKWTSTEKRFTASVGRLDYVYTGLERTTSSKKIVTFERGLLPGQLMPGEVVGLYTDTKLDALSFRAGIYSGNIGDEFSDFDAGVAAGLGLVTDLPLGYEKGKLHLDYLYNDGDPENNAFEPYQQIISIWHRGEAGAISLGVDVTLGTGSYDARPDVLGLTLIPTYDLLQNWLIDGDNVQLAMRYQITSSDGNNGLNVPRRYEHEVVSGEGDLYQALYLGLNYQIYGERLKLMAGAEYAQMQDNAGDGGDYRGWTYLAGLRLYF